MRNKRKKGYFNGEHSHKGKIVFATKGDHVLKIKSWGVGQFYKFIKNYNNAEHLVYQWLS